MNSDADEVAKDELLVTFFDKRFVDNTVSQDASPGKHIL